MKKNYDTIISLGTQEGHSNRLNKKIRLLNTFCLIWGHLVLFFYSLEMITGLITEAISQHKITFDFFYLDSFITYFFIIGSIILTLFLNTHFYFKWARSLFISTVIISNIYASLVLTPGCYIEYYFYVVYPSNYVDRLIIL